MGKGPFWRLGRRGVIFLWQTWRIYIGSLAPGHKLDAYYFDNDYDDLHGACVFLLFSGKTDFNCCNTES